ncbi:MAG TPA: T9SS type A sorting domain-containing protein [Flavobacterium sp.]|nr:T9SS type A sorting domain-containing protein [Flavobacterium sp.]
MKNFTLLAFAVFSGLISRAQTSFEASGDYAKLQDITYDATVQNKLYAATNGNHIVVSVDNGAHWDLLYSYPANDFIKDLKLLPGNTALSFGTYDKIHILDLATNTLTASFTVPQSGVADAGLSWLNSYDFYDAAGTTIIVDTGFSVGFGSFGKTFYTKDSGAHWDEIYYTVDHENVFINDVAISPGNSDKLFLARGNGDSDVDGGLWISDNDGADWTESISGITLDAISFNPSDANDILIGSSIGFGIHPENLFRSGDNGVNWNIIPVTWTDETLNNITKIVFNPANPDQIIVLEENEIVRSNDGGATWSNIVYPVGISMDYYYGINASFNPFDANQVAITTDFYPQFLNNTNATLTQIKAPFFNILGTSIGKYSGDTHLYYGGQGGRQHKAISSGVISAYDVENPDSFNPKKNYMFADPAIAGRVFTYASMGFFGGWVNVSTDYGATTTNILQAFADDMQELAVDPNNSNIVYVSLRSGEGGNVVKIDISDLSNIITTDIITPEVNEFGEGVVTGIVIDPTNSDIIYISKKNKILKTVDGGLVWAEIGTGLEDVTSVDIIWDMAGNPLNPQQLTIGTNIGVYTSVDSGEHWSAILPGIDAKRIKHSPLNNGVIAVTVFSTANVNASIAYTANNGTDWNFVQTEDLHYVQSYGMDYDFDGTDINAYIATTDLGVLKYPIHNVVLGTYNPVADNPVGIYPNPANGAVKILTNDGTGITAATVYSLTGQKVLESQSATFDVSNLSNGIYIVKVKSAGGKYFSEKLVKE